MANWKTILILAVGAAALWWLYPARQLAPQQDGKDVVEIVYMGPGGPIAGAMDDAVREFEKLSEEAHRRDPNKPIYRVVSGQNAARDQVADPTRFLLSVAGGSPPDVIWFDRYAVTEWASRGAFEPLDSYVQRDREDIKAGRRPDLKIEDVFEPNQFYQCCWDEAMYKGSVYSLPASVDTRALFYNKDLLRRARDRLIDLAEDARVLDLIDQGSPLGPPDKSRIQRLIRDNFFDPGAGLGELLTQDKPLDGSAKARLLDQAANAARLKAAAQDESLRPEQRAKLLELAEYAKVLNVALRVRLRLDDVLADPAARRNSEVKPPESWEALRVYALVLTEKDEKGKLKKDEKGKLKVVGFAPQFGNSHLYMYGWMAGGEYMSADGRTCTLNHPGVVEGLAFMREVYDSLAPEGGNGYEYVSSFQAGFGGGGLDPFIQGKVAMKIDGAWQMSNLASYGRDLNFGVSGAPLPKRRITPGCKTISWAGGWAYAIPRVARNKQAAWEFIRFMVSQRGLRIRFEGERALSQAQGRLYIPGQLPQIRLNEMFFKEYVYDNPQVPQKYKDGCRMFNDMLPEARYRPATPVGQLLWNEHTSAMEAALRGRKSPQEALDYGKANVQKSLDRILDPPPGVEIRSWNWFFFLYGGILVAMALLVYYWDTHPKFRQRLARLLRRKKDQGVIEGSRGGYFRSQWFGGFVCAAPWIIGFIVFAGGPMLYSIIMSFCDFDVINPAKFTGLDNYRWMFTKDELFPLALWNTAYMIVGVPLGMAVSLSMAVLLNAKVRGISVWRTLFYLPAIVPMVAASVLWIWIFNPEQGFLNKLLDLVGIEGPRWLHSVHWSKPSLILMGLWGAGSGMIIWLAGLKGINQQLYEAASVDGANAWRRFLHITIPQLTPYIFFNLVMGMINTFQIFGQAFIMTQGGPDNSTLFIVYHLFNNAFRYGHMGYASAMAWVLFVIVLVLTIIQVKGSRRWVYYESE